MFRVTRKAKTAREAQEECAAALKEMMWDEVWKSSIEAPVKRAYLEKGDDGMYEVTMEV